MTATELLVPGGLDIAQLRRLAGTAPCQVKLDPACRPGMRASAEVVRRAAAGEAPVYGVNTGFGKLASTRIPRPTWSGCSSTCCARTPSAWASRCRRAWCA